MKAISLFSGVGGFDLGFERAGIETVLQAERDPHCLKVLERHWPQVRRVTDVRCVGNRGFRREAERRAGSGLGDQRGDDVHLASERASTCDLIFGGFPCQDLSVAGKRAGLGGERSGLWFEFHRVLSELRPRWTVIENVPGLLSSNNGRDFAILLMGLEELGYGWAYRVLDARYARVPQRRRRVFIVGCLGDRLSARQVLSVCESCGGNPETGRAPGERVAYSLTAGVRGTGDGHGNAWNSNYVTAIQDVRGVRDKKQNGIGIAQGEPMYTLDGTSQHGIHVANPLGSSRGGIRLDLDNDTYIPDIVGTLSDGAHFGGGLTGQDAYTGRIFAPTSGVRRLTPLECERLQGFPDGWTDLPQSDSHRYRQMGNAVCVPVAEWIGHRIVAMSKVVAA